MDKTDPEEIMSSTTQRNGLTEQGVKGYDGNAMQKFILHLPGAPQPSFWVPGEVSRLSHETQANSAPKCLTSDHTYTKDPLI